ncbi:signal transduction protein [endosymbiont of unidentified scaly snail isolate Monju]|nr:signal transduction protein [endosymbiont of unidentified scaly snail isolate Monju]
MPLLLLTVLAGLLVLWVIQNRYQDFVTYQANLAKNHVTSVAQEVQLYLKDRRHVARLFIQEQGELLSRLVVHPDDRALRKRLAKRVRDYFPTMHSFNLGDPWGDVLLGDEAQDVGEACRADISYYAQHRQPGEVYIHDDSLGPHIDILGSALPGENGQAHVFFVSIDAEGIETLLARTVAPDHELLLLRSDRPGRVELTSGHGHWQRGDVLDDTARGRILHAIDIPGTGWKLADMVSPGLFSSHREALCRDAAAVFAFFLVMAILLMARVYREEGRRLVAEQALARLNRDLDRQVRARTRELEASRRQLIYQATHDALTGLINRREFEQRLHAVIERAKRGESRGCLLYLDLNQFKVVNDTAGHTAGDELLRQVARLMQGVVGEEHTLARLGGDEFGVILENVDREEVLGLTRSLRAAIRGYHFQWEARLYQIGISIGGVLLDEKSGDTVQVMSRADAACYESKECGAGEAYIADVSSPELDARQRIMWRHSDIVNAGREGRLLLFLQPIVALSGPSVEWYECLLRLRDRDGQLIPPGEFIHAAERYGGMTDLDLWVFDQAIELLSSNADLHLNINFSGQTLGDTRIQGRVLDRLKAFGQIGGRLCIEITETAMVHNLSRAQEFMQQLHLKGVRLALDDFGSGISSFSYLKVLPVDYVKLDGSLVIDIAEDGGAYTIVDSIDAMVRTLGKQTIAEYVENAAVERALREIGVELAQGFYYARPLPADGVLAKRARMGNGLEV